MGGTSSRQKILSSGEKSIQKKITSPTQVQPPEKYDPKRWINLKGREFEESPDRWYNLLTSRYIKRQPKYASVFSIRGIRVLGTTENLVEFWKTNLDHLGQSLPKHTSFENVIFNPFEDITFLSEDASQRSQMCFLGTAGTVIPAAQTMDVAELPLELINKMCKFSFAGLFTKGRVVYVVDGDTLDVVIFVPLVMLGAARSIGSDGGAQIGALLTPGFERVGFRSEEHTSELQSHSFISYAVFCLKKKKER